MLLVKPLVGRSIMERTENSREKENSPPPPPPPRRRRDDAKDEGKKKKRRKEQKSEVNILETFMPGFIIPCYFNVPLFKRAALCTGIRYPI